MPPEPQHAHPGPADPARCVHCGTPAGRPVGANWLCQTCHIWQDAGRCTTCGQQVYRDGWERRGHAWPPRKEDR